MLGLGLGSSSLHLVLVDPLGVGHDALSLPP